MRTYHYKHTRTHSKTGRAFLGVLDSFFSDSTAVSNLTFGLVESVAAANNGEHYARTHTTGTFTHTFTKRATLKICRAFLGVLGSFFSGSTTISNLTFGQVQSVAAANIGVSQASMLALQACGATAGNAVCINNIISGMFGSLNIGLVHGDPALYGEKNAFCRIATYTWCTLSPALYIVHYINVCLL